MSAPKTFSCMGFYNGEAEEMFIPAGAAAGTGGAQSELGGGIRPQAVALESPPAVLLREVMVVERVQDAS